MKDISKLGLNFQKPLIMDFYNNNSSIDYSSKYGNNYKSGGNNQMILLHTAQPKQTPNQTMNKKKSTIYEDIDTFLNK